MWDEHFWLWLSIVNECWTCSTCCTYDKRLQHICWTCWQWWWRLVKQLTPWDFNMSGDSDGGSDVSFGVQRMAVRPVNSDISGCFTCLFCHVLDETATTLKSCVEFLLWTWEVGKRIWTFLLHSPPRSGTWFSQGTQAGRFGWTVSWWKVLDGTYLVQNGVDKIWPRYSYDTCWLKKIVQTYFEVYVQKVEMKTPTKRFKLIATRRWNVPYAWIKTWPIPFNLDAE